MRYYRCRCGKLEAHCSGMLPHPCTGCPDCGTNLAEAPGAHKAPLPHAFVVGQVETDEGMKPLSRCTWCMKTRRQLESEQASEQGKVFTREECIFRYCPHPSRCAAACQCASKQSEQTES
jgi:hypothetical protein